MNTFTIARKELNSYFRSPIAYGVMAFFALIAGYFFYVAVVFFVQHEHAERHDGAVLPDERERMGGAAAAFEHQRDRAVPDPHDHHAAVRRRKAHRHHRAAGDFAAARSAKSSWASGWRAMALYAAMLGISAAEHADAVRCTASRTGGRCWSAIWACCCKADACWRSGRSFRTAPRIRSSPAWPAFGVCLLLWVLDWVSQFRQFSHWSK